MSRKERKEEERRLIEAQVDIVVDYLENDGVVVEFGGTINGYFYEDELITISNKQSAVSKLYTLLHEAGHHILRTQVGRFKDSQRRPGRKNKSQRMEVLHEEFLAWDAGYDLAKELDLYIDEDKWKNISHKHLYDYVSWAHKPIEFRRKYEKK